MVSLKACNLTVAGVGRMCPSLLHLHSCVVRVCDVHACVCAMVVFASLCVWYVYVVCMCGYAVWMCVYACMWCACMCMLCLCVFAALCVWYVCVLCICMCVYAYMCCVCVFPQVPVSWRLGELGERQGSQFFFAGPSLHPCGPNSSC